MSGQEARFHSLDAVRALALLLGIVLHGAMSFMPALAAAGWPIIDRSPSQVLTAVGFVIHVFRMTTFFVIAGFFAHLLYQRLGAREFLKNRSKRVLVPLLVSWGFLIPTTIAVFVWALTSKGAPLTPPPQQAGAVPLMHLWFLYLLCLLYISALTVRLLIVRFAPNGLRERVDSVIARLTGQPLAVVPLALPVAVSLYFHERWLPAGGIPTPDMSLIPNLPAFVAYGVAFAFGWLLHRQAEPLANLSRLRWANIALAVVLTLGAMTLVTNTAATSAGTGRILFAAVYAMASWSWTFAILGAAANFMSAERPAIRYLADASYWMYLVHLPIVFALAQAISDWPLHWSIKFPLLMIATVALLLASYHWLVRFTFLGKALNGKRQHHPSTATSAESHQFG
jgi:peptidoglycan/LPS O-acetylase OafA/YrhL